MRPAAESLRRDCIDYLRDPLTVRRFLALLSHTGYLNCNVPAKFLRVMARVLILPAHQAEEKPESVLLFDQLSMFMKRLCVPTLQVLKLSKDRPLKTHEQILCTEMARLTTVIGRNIPFIEFSNREMAQNRCVEVCLERFISDIMVRAMVQMVLYDLQVDTGSAHGEFINDGFVQSASNRAGMREFCSTVLAQQLHRCPPAKYMILEAFSNALIFQKQAVRLSYLSELLQTTTSGKFNASLETLLSGGVGHPARILLTVPAEIFVDGRHSTRTMVVSTRNYHIVDTVPDVMSCGVCPPENFCPHKPSIERVRPYGDLTRIVRGFGNQLLALGWIKPDDSEEFEIILCQRSRDRDELLQTLHALSAPHAQAETHDRVSLEFDGLMKKAVQNFVNASWIGALTFALRADKASRLSLFVLTENELFEFRVDFEYWIPHPDDEGADSEDEIGPQLDDLEEMALEEQHQHDKRHTSSYEGAENRPRTLMDRTQYHQYIYPKTEIPRHIKERTNEIREKREEAKRRGENSRLDLAAGGSMQSKEKKQTMLDRTLRNLLKLEVQKPLSSLTLIAFHPGEVPAMRLDLEGEQLLVNFFDDTARESWRRALVCALNKSDTSSQWVRGWLNPTTGPKD